MRSILALGTGLVLLTALGHGGIKLLRLGQGQRVYARLALDLVIGCGFGSLLVFWFSLARTSLGLAGASAVAVLALAATVVGAVRRRREWLTRATAALKRIERPRSPAAWSRLLLAVCLLLAATIAHVTLVAGLGWDGLAIWGLKAKAIFTEGGVSQGLFHDLSRQWSHLNYPLLLPATEAWLYHFLGQVNEGAVKVVFVAFEFSLLALFYSALRRQHAAWYAAVFTFILGSMPALVRNGSTGYADVPLSALAFGSSAFLYLWLEEGRRSDLWLSAVLAALAPWAKREGAVLWLIDLGAVLLLAGRARGWALRERFRAGLAFALPALLVAPWFVFAAWQRLPDNDFAISAAALASHVARLPVLARLLLGQLADVRSWGILWEGVALAALWRQRGATRGERYLLAAVGAYIVLLTGAFVFSTWEPYVAHVGASLERLVLHVCPAALLYVAVRLGRAELPVRQLEPGGET